MTSAAAKGFSLVELLVALLVIALLASATVLSLAPDDTAAAAAEEQALHLFDQFQLARQEAVLANQPLGLRLMADAGQSGWRLEWLRLQGGAWQAAGDLLPPTSLPAALQLKLEVEGELWQPDTTASPSLPQLLLEPDGWIAPFRLSLQAAGGDLPLSISVDARGTLRGWWEEAQ